jgi:hypothetical protein
MLERATRTSKSIGTSLVEVCIHNILYVRQVYPVELFVKRKKYGTPVFQSRHPDLNEYIAGAVLAVKEELVRVSDRSSFLGSWL